MFEFKMVEVVIMLNERLVPSSNRVMTSKSGENCIYYTSFR